MYVRDFGTQSESNNVFVVTVTATSLNEVRASGCLETGVLRTIFFRHRLVCVVVLPKIPRAQATGEKTHRN